VTQPADPVHGASVPHSAERALPVRNPPSIGPVEFDVRVWVYGTITLTSVLVVFDGWADLSSTANLIAVVMGPTIALAIAHLFADVVDLHADQRQALRLDQFRHIVRHSAEYLLVAVPPLLVFFLVGWLTGDSRVAIRAMVLSGSASLGVWGFVAGWRTGYRGGRLLMSTMVGLVMGIVIIVLQIVLKPH
jgi:hypothetical protein